MSLLGIILCSWENLVRSVVIISIIVIVIAIAIVVGLIMAIISCYQMLLLEMQQHA